MQVTITGSGTSQGVPVIGCDCKVCKSNDKKDKRFRCSVHISYKGKSIVIDTGPDFRQQMLNAEIKSLDAVLFTHEHKDHVAGLDDVRPFNFSQKKPIDIYCVNYILYSSEQLKLIQNEYRRLRDFSIISFLGVYLLQIIDANVEAHLFLFDISDNLSINFKPKNQNNVVSSYLVPQFSLNFKL